MTATKYLHPSPFKGEDDTALRPVDLDDFIGQAHLHERITIAVKSAQIRNEPCDHMVFSGPPGLGKTSLANVVASAMGKQCIVTGAPALKRPIDLVTMLLRMERGGVLFIDEIHALRSDIEEYLYPAMEDHVVDLITAKQSKGMSVPPMRVPIQHFTLIGATTKLGKLGQPLRHRFGMDMRFEFYQVNELNRIIKRSAELLKVTITDDACAVIAKASRGTPRIANRLLRRIRDYALVKTNGQIESTTCYQAMALEGVDRKGLDEQDRRYLDVLINNYDGGPKGLNVIAATMQVEPEQLEEVVEPFLLANEYIVRSDRGRVATKRAFNHLSEMLNA